MNAEGPVRPRAVDAEKHPVGHACPAGVLGTTVKTHLKENFKIQLLIPTSQKGDLTGYNIGFSLKVT